MLNLSLQRVSPASAPGAGQTASGAGPGEGGNTATLASAFRALVDVLADAGAKSGAGAAPASPGNHARIAETPDAADAPNAPDTPDAADAADAPDAAGEDDGRAETGAPAIAVADIANPPSFPVAVIRTAAVSVAVAGPDEGADHQAAEEGDAAQSSGRFIPATTPARPRAIAAEGAAGRAAGSADMAGDMGAAQTVAAAARPTIAGTEAPPQSSGEHDAGPRPQPRPMPVAAAPAPASDGAAATVAPATAFHLPVLASSTGAPTVAVAPAGVTIAPRDLLPDDTTAGMVQAIRLQVTRGGGEAHIRLAPGELGELTIAIRVHQGQVIAQLQAESPVVREWLRSHQGWLRDSLAEQQLTLGRLEISEPPAESRHADRRGADERGPRQERHPGRRRRPQPGDHPERFDVVA